MAKQDEKENKEKTPAKALKENTGDAYKVLVKPLVTEKIHKLSPLGVVAFKVSDKANKITVANAVEKVYDVKVERVNIISMPGKPRNFGGRVGHTGKWKKAIVTLKKGEVIQE
jgi:large subunit ribosomal protein L23